MRAATNTFTSFSKDFLSASCVAGSVLRAWGTLNQTDEDTHASDFSFFSF